MTTFVDYQTAVIDKCTEFVGVRERGRNAGPEVAAFLETVGLGTGNAWCAAFVYAIHKWAAESLGANTECPRSGSAVALWLKARRANLLTFRPDQVKTGLIYPQPGDVFVRVRRGRAQDVDVVTNEALRFRDRRRKGHTGIVTGMDEHGVVHTIEGNTNSAGSAEGDGVYRKAVDLDMPELVGFIRPFAG